MKKCFWLFTTCAFFFSSLFLGCDDSENALKEDLKDETTVTWYKDADSDGYSDGATQESSNKPEGYYKPSSLIAISGDCNDLDIKVHPGVEEICGDGIDNDCNGNDLECNNGQAILGPLAHAVVNIYSLDNSSQPLFSTQTDEAGYFQADLAGMDSDEYLLVSVTGGLDIDPDDDGITDDTPVENSGTISALISVADFNKGDFKVSALTDFAWRFTNNLIGEVDNTGIVIRLNDIAAVFFKEEADINQDGELNEKDITAFDPTNTEHRAMLGFDYERLFEPNESGFSIMGAYHGNMENVLLELLDRMFRARLTRFVAPDSRYPSVKVALVPFGRGYVSADSGNIDYSSERTEEENITEDLYQRDNNKKIILTAEPIEETEILGWSGCDSVSEDLTTCECTLSDDRLVMVNFGYKETKVVSNYLDISRADVEMDGTQMYVKVPMLDYNLRDQMDQVTEGYYLTGSTGNGFLIRVTSIEKTGLYNYTLTTEPASLEDVILQGTSVLSRQMKHGDLSEDEDADDNNRSRSMRAGPMPSAEKIEPVVDEFKTADGVELIPSDNPNDTVFTIRFGEPAGESRQILGRTGDENDDSTEQKAEHTFKTDSGVEMVVTGEVDIEILFDVGLSFGLTGLEEFKFIPEVRATESLGIAVTGEANWSWEPEPIISIPFGKVAFTIGPVPVWLTFQLDISIGANAEVKAEISSSIELRQVLNAGFRYAKSSGVELIKGFTKSYDFNPPSLEAELEAQGYLQTAGSVLIYGQTGPRVTIEPGVKLTGTNQPVGTCKGGLNFATYFTLNSMFNWDFSGEAADIIGKFVDLEKIEEATSFTIFEDDFPISAWNIGGNCTLPKLKVSGDNIYGTIRQGVVDTVSRDYVLNNPGNDALDWSVDQPNDGITHFSETQGALGAGESKTITITVDTSTMPVGIYSKSIVFRNDSASGFWASLGKKIGLPDYLTGGSLRIISIITTPPEIPAPVMAEPKLISPNTVEIEWSYPEPSRYVEGYYISQATDISEENSNWKPVEGGQITSVDQFSHVVSGLLPGTTYYFAVIAYGDDYVQSDLSNVVEITTSTITVDFSGTWVMNKSTNWIPSWFEETPPEMPEYGIPYREQAKLVISQEGTEITGVMTTTTSFSGHCNMEPMTTESMVQGRVIDNHTLELTYTDQFEYQEVECNYSNGEGIIVWSDPEPDPYTETATYEVNSTSRIRELDFEDYCLLKNASTDECDILADKYKETIH